MSWANRRWPALPLALVASACGSAEHGGEAPTSSVPPAALVAEARPIGRGEAFRPSATGPVTGRCTKLLGQRSGVHVEVFAANRVALIPAGIGTRPPRRYLSGRIARTGCYGGLVTLDPTGLVLVRPGAHLDVADLFRSWGQPLTTNRLLTFRASDGVRAFVDGRPWRGVTKRIPLRPHAEIVLEVGPYVPPHSAYTFPPGV